MGWTFTSKNGLSTKEFFERNFNCSTHKVLDCAVTSNAAYMASQITPKDGRPPYVGALICLIQYDRKSVLYPFGYKDMDETMGPFEAHCPERILKLLSPVEELGCSEYGRENARKWREACWANLALRKTAKAAKEGSVIKFAEPIGFTNGFKHDTFQLTLDGRKERFFPAYPPGTNINVIPGGYRHYRITNWKTRQFEIQA